MSQTVNMETSILKEEEIDSVLPNFLNRVNKQFEDYKEKPEETFNIFDCLTKHHLEELHSKFITYLLNPKAKHGLGDIFLKLFIELLNKQFRIADIIPIGDYKNVKVENEHPFSIMSKITGRIDIYIETDGWVIAIENKIYAAQQKNQIDRYVKYCEKKKFKVIYLTIDGCKSHSMDTENVINISYKFFITEWLKQCIEKTKQYPHVSTSVSHYLNLIKSSILFNYINDFTMNVENVINEEQNKVLLKHWDSISTACNQLKEELRLNFIKSVVEKLNSEIKVELNPISEEGIEMNMDNLLDSNDNGLILEKDDYVYKTEDQTEIKFLVWNDNGCWFYGLNTFKTKGNKKNSWHKTSKQIAEKIESKFNGIHLDNGESNYNWFAFKYFRLSPGEFFEDSNNTDYELASSNALVDKFSDDINVYLKEWKRIVIELRKENNL